LEALQGLGDAAKQAADVPETTLSRVELRASQINGCSICVDMHSRELRHAGEPDERIYTVGASREAPYLTDADRAALALAEASRRAAAGSARARDRRDQRVEPHQRRHAIGHT
jgi:AhpD family alkylhydroperoxidase